MTGIDELLQALQDPNQGLKGSPSEIWARISRKDKFDELGLNADEVENIIKEFIEANPYNNI